MKGLVVGFVAILVVAGACSGGGDSDGGSGGSGDGYYDVGDPANYVDECEQWNRDNPDMAGPVDQCAQDAAELGDDMAEYVENNP
jgi:hypothetical protein